MWKWIRYKKGCITNLSVVAFSIVHFQTFIDKAAIHELKGAIILQCFHQKCPWMGSSTVYQVNCMLCMQHQIMHDCKKNYNYRITFPLASSPVPIQAVMCTLPGEIWRHT